MAYRGMINIICVIVEPKQRYKPKQNYLEKN